MLDSAGNIVKVVCDPEIIYLEKDVLPILISSCAYPRYHDTKTAVSPMPDGVEKLDDCSIQLVAIWITEGTLNN